MRIKFAPEVVEALGKIKKKDLQLTHRIQKQLIIFASNPRHPSLRVHKLSGNFKNRWSISITNSVRMVYLLVDDDVAYFVAIGTHDQVYKK
jgi:addiction module RelE/StbE family toxin